MIRTMAALTVVLCPPMDAAAKGARIIFKDCAISARQSHPDGELEKLYHCSNGDPLLIGEWRSASGNRKEFGEYWFGEVEDFGVIHRETNNVFLGCISGNEGGNYDGYFSEYIEFKCGDKDITLKGTWSDEYQGNWNYHLIFGEIKLLPSWSDDPKRIIDFSSFQKWCPTKYGYRLCGWIDQPTVDHGKPPLFKRD